ncbi:MAG: hypothetical protein JWR80_2045 [Bradyrhizobium sp.]|nr:hypothetical protein [Bradyrhizobium sp.]
MLKFLVLAFMAALAASSAHAQDTRDTRDTGRQLRLMLAQQYLDITHKDKRLRDMLAGSARLTWNTCPDDACRSALDKAIGKAVDETAPEFERAYTKIVASHLTVEQLQAVVAFARSPNGQAILAAEAEMEGDLLNISHPFALSVSEGVRHSFCATQAEACARVYARFATKPSH